MVKDSFIGKTGKVIQDNGSKGLSMGQVCGNQEKAIHI